MKIRHFIWLSVCLSVTYGHFAQYNQFYLCEQASIIDTFQYETYKIFKFKMIDGSVFYESNFNDTISIDNYNLAQQIVHERFFFIGMFDSVFYSFFGKPNYDINCYAFERKLLYTDENETTTYFGCFFSIYLYNNLVVIWDEIICF